MTFLGWLLCRPSIRDKEPPNWTSYFPQDLPNSTLEQSYTVIEIILAIDDIDLRNKKALVFGLRELFSFIVKLAK